MPMMVLLANARGDGVAAAPGARGAGAGFASTAGAGDTGATGNPPGIEPGSPIMVRDVEGAAVRTGSVTGGGVAGCIGVRAPGVVPGRPIIVRWGEGPVARVAGAAGSGGETAGGTEARAGTVTRSAPQAPQKESLGLQGVPQLGQRKGTVMEPTR